MIYFLLYKKSVWKYFFGTFQVLHDIIWPPPGGIFMNVFMNVGMFANLLAT